MVRAAGVEPALLSELDFESSASTNSTTPAQAMRTGSAALPYTGGVGGSTSDAHSPETGAPFEGLDRRSLTETSP